MRSSATPWKQLLTTIAERTRADDTHVHRVTEI